MSTRPSRAVVIALQSTLWELLDLDDRDHGPAFLEVLDDAIVASSGSTDPRWSAWAHALTARRHVIENQTEATVVEVAAARELLDKCPPSADVALALAYLAHVAVAADHFDAAMLLAVDASLLTESFSVGEPTRALLLAHRWLARTLSGLDLEELAVAHADRGHGVALALPGLADRWRMLLLSARQHVELAQTRLRRGDTELAHELAALAIDQANAARALSWEPEPAEADLLDVVQARAMGCRGELEAALGPLRRVRRRVEADGGIWLRAVTAMALGRVLATRAQRDGDPVDGEESMELLVAASGGFAACGDRRRYRQCLLELGQNSADLGRPAEALHWLEAYRADTGRANSRSREMWADMFVRRSRLREAERTAALLRRHALEDPLTGLGNRRSAERRLGGLRLGVEPLSLAVVDVDKFKLINDDTSHTNGDAVLRRVAELLREHSRNGDEVFRWAGDEFVVVLPRATQAQALVITERLRAAVAGADWTDLHLPAPVTVSIGLASAPVASAEQPAPAVGWRALFDTADLHLFSAKRSGRNRIGAPGMPVGVAEDTPDESDGA